MTAERHDVDAPIIQVIVQRHESDCGAAVLAMICGVSYEEALLAIGRSVPDVLTTGVFPKDIQAAAKELGYKLRRRTAIDWEDDTGALNVSFAGGGPEHVVVLRAGLIIDTDGTLWAAHDYLRAKRARARVLLIPEPIK